MNYIKRSAVIKAFSLFLLVLIFAKMTSAQHAGEYYPLHVGDYWIQHTDSLDGEPGTFRMEVEDIDNIRGTEYFRMKQQLVYEDTGEEYTKWYVWIKEDTSGILIGAFGDSSAMIDLNIPTQTITVDGNPTDWSGITALATDPQGDDSPSFTGDDIKALYISSDADHLFIRMDLWDNVNTDFQNSPPPYDGSYSICIDNNGPYREMDLGIAYNSNLSQWSLSYNGSSTGVPAGLEGPDFVGVSGNIIELRIPLNLIGNPSQYNQIIGEVNSYYYQYGSVLDELRVDATFVFDPPIQWIDNDMLKAGFSWEFDAPKMGGHYVITLVSSTETVQVPAGTFPNCARLKQIITNSDGDTTQVQDIYLARGVGEVLKRGWNDWNGRMDFELTDYSVQAIQVNQDNTAQAGQNLNLSIASSNQNFQPTTKRLYYRSAGESSWQFLNITTSGTNFNVTIPQNVVTLRGIEYYVYLSNGQQVLTYPELDPEIRPAVIQVAVNNYTASLTLQGMTYQMISVPLQLSNTHVLNVLQDDLEQYNPEQWRLFRWENGDYVEYPDITANFTPGTAFWLITRYGGSFDVENGLSVDSSQPFSYTMQPGWNQVANPFAFPILADSVKGAQDMLERPVYYNGTQYEYDVAIIQPWQGYFVFNNSNSPLTIYVRPIAADTSSPKISKRIAVDIESEYLLQLLAAMPGTRLIDTQNYIGLRNQAIESRDELDLTEAPPIGEYLQLSIVENNERFAANFKPIQGKGQQWELEVNVSSRIERAVEIDLQETGHLPEGHQLYVLDKDYNCAIPATEKRFSVDLTSECPVRHLKILLGTKEYAEQNNQGISLIPINFALKQNFPNPFNPETTIPYQLGRRSLVLLDIYNVLGQRIRTLVNGIKNTGQYAVTWDGRDDAGKSIVTGIYICHFKAGEFTATRKLILVR